MFRHLLTVPILLVLGVFAFLQSGNDEAAELRELHSRRWNQALEASGVGTTLDDLAKILDGKYVFSGWIPYGGSGSAEHVYVLDDVTEVTVAVDVKGKIITPPLKLRSKSQGRPMPIC